jgi:DNA polymerase-3 subunit delta
VSRRPKKRTEGLDFDGLRRHLKAGKVEPLYLFTGDEDYLHQQALNSLFETLDEAGRDFNISIFQIDEGKSTGGRTTASAAIDAANQLPMLSSRRIIIIRDFEKIKEAEVESVLEYLKHPLQSSTVVFQAHSLDHRRKLSNALTRSCAIVVFDPFDDRRAAAWVEGYLKSRGFGIESRALGLLIELAGTRLSRLVNELEKLMTYTADGAITAEAVGALVPRAREHQGLDLWDAIVRGERARALKLACRLLDDGEAPVLLIGSLGGLFRRLLLGKELIARNAPRQEVMRTTSFYGDRLSVLTRGLGRISREDIVYGINRIADVDNAIKNSEATPRLQIEFLVAELTLPGGSR